MDEMMEGGGTPVQDEGGANTLLTGITGSTIKILYHLSEDCLAFIALIDVFFQLQIDCMFTLIFSR
jgi:hypothetical protein